MLNKTSLCYNCKNRTKTVEGLCQKCDTIKLPKSKHRLGYSRKEILDIIRPLNIHHKTFWSKFGINTCSINKETNETIYYYYDVLLTIKLCLEKRERRFCEWD